MNSEWKKVSISDTILSSNTGLDAIKRAPIVDYNSGIKCLRIQDISQDKSFKDWGFCSVEDKNYSKFQLKKGDIIVARTGATIGVNKLIKNDLVSVYNNGLIRLKVNSDIIDYRYLYYNMQGVNYKGHIQAISGGTSTQPNMKMNALLDFKINLPSLTEQNGIADTLSCLDDKIELNNCINKTLEEVAQAIFKSWFVDFDPFQDGEFEDNELGRIPKGWRNGRVIDMGTVLTGKTPPTVRTEFYGNDIPFIKTPDMHGNIYITAVENKLSLKGAEYQNNKYIPKNSVIMSCIGAKAGVVSLTSELSQTNQQINAVISEWPYYMYYTLKKESDNLRNAGSSGSTMININKSTFENYKIIIPNKSILRKFNEKVQSIFDMILNNQNENRNLEILRNLLLPKLMSGEIRVPTEEVQ